VVTEYKNCEDADTVFVSLWNALRKRLSSCDYCARQQRQAKVGSICQGNQSLPEAAIIQSLGGKKNVQFLSEPMKACRETTRWLGISAWRWAKRTEAGEVRRKICRGACQDKTPRIFRGFYGIGSRDFRPECNALGAYGNCDWTRQKSKDGKGQSMVSPYLTPAFRTIRYPSFQKTRRAVARQSQ